MKGEEVCFVTTDKLSESSRWLLYAAKALSAKVCTFLDLEQGVAPTVPVYVLERDCWRFPFNRYGDARKLVWLDDAYHIMPTLSNNYRFWHDFHPEFLRHLRRCDGIIAPNPYLLAAYSEYVDDVYLIPNYHDFPKLKLNKRHRKLVGWGGSFCHWTSWRDTQLYKHIPNNVTPVIVGHHPVYQMVKRYHPDAIGKPTMSHDDYLREVASWSTYLIPVHGSYDRCRSNIKAIEAAYTGTPWLAVGDAANDVYRGCHGGQCNQVDGVAIFHEEALARTPQQRRDAQAWAEEQRITNHLDEWWEALKG